MAKSFAEVPLVEFNSEDIWEGWFPNAQVQAALEHGPIYKWIIEEGYDPGEYVYMVGPEANRFVFHTGREHFSHDLGWTPIIGRDFGKGLLNMDPPEHTRHRRMWNPAFTRVFIESYIPVIERVIITRTASWVERGEVDVYAEAREITFDAAAAALAGFEPGPQVDKLRQLFYVLLHGFEPEDETFEEFQQRMDDARKNLATMLLQLIAQRRAMPEDEEPRDVLGMIVRARDEDGQRLSDEQLLAHVNILLIAGHETTTTLSAWVLYLLATMPEWRERLLAELDAAAPVATSGILPMETFRELPLLDSFIKETGRLYPPVLNVPRGVLSAFEFGGYEIPAGASVRLALGASHLLPSVFDAPERFDPERFLAPREEERRTPYSLVTFGSGPRICIGINFAQIETKALTAYVLRHFQLEPVTEQEPARTGHWTMQIAQGIRLRVTRRP